MDAMMAKRRQQNEGRPTQAGPREQRHIDAQDDARNDPTNAADYQTDLGAAGNVNAAVGDSTGNARRSSEASGQPVEDNALADLRQAQQRSRGGVENGNPARSD
jgi:hypothetical protein